MIFTPLTVSLLLHAVSLSPTSVPARGLQETLITLDRAAHVAITASTPEGTACEIVDQVRGPFAQSGEVGRSNCELDLLLDAGTYKLRLTSSTQGKKAPGKVELKAVTYTEDNPQPVRLEAGREVTQRLAPQHQASYWLKIERRQPVTLRVAGRSVGDVRLWRNGAWLEPASFSGTVNMPREGQPQYEWWMNAPLDPGDYLVTAYASSPKSWTEGREDNTLTVAYGFPMAPSSTVLDLTLPSTGLSTLELPQGPLALLLSREGTASASSTATRVSLSTIGADGTTSLSGGEGCSIAAKAIITQCSVLTSRPGRHLALVRGEPGTRVHLQWSPMPGANRSMEGTYSAGSTVPTFQAQHSGESLVSLHEVPASPDSAPLGCMLETERRGEWTPIASDMLEVGPSRPFRRAFNYSGSNATVWFRVSKTGTYALSTSGEHKVRCDLYQVNGTQRALMSEPNPLAQTCRISRPLTAGEYELKLYGGIDGIESLSLAVEGQQAQEDTATHSSCLMQHVPLEQGARYRVITTRSTAGVTRGLFVRPQPLTLAEPLPVSLEGPQPVELKLTPGETVEVRSLEGEAFTCALEGNRVEVRDGHCTLPATGGTLSLSHTGSLPSTLMLYRTPPAQPPLPALSQYNPTITPLPAIQPSEPAWFDFERGQAHSLTFDVKKEGLYHVTTLGLLATECTMRTPVVVEVGSASGGGRGRNCLVSTYLRPGRYLLTARVTGSSRGRAGVLLERREVKSAESVRADGEVFFRTDADELVQQRLTVPREAHYTLSSTAQGAQLQCRLDDAQGWPLVPVPTSCTQSLRLAGGTYLWTQLPLTVESMRRTSLERVQSPEVLQGNKVHSLAFDRWYQAQLGKDGKDEFAFEVPARMDVILTLSGGMQGRLSLEGADGKLRPVEVIAPQNVAAPPPPPTEVSEESESEPSPRPEDSDEESSQGERMSARRGAETSAPPPPGQRLTLEPGRYRLETEHSQGDVAISYALYLRTEVFAPSMSKEVQVPGRFPLLLPVNGTLRLFTRGDTDVRCRLFDVTGRLVVESADHGADWNCALAEPLPAGTYSLVLESQTQRPGPTRVSVELAQVSDAGVLAEGGTLQVGSGVVRATLPPSPAEALQQVALQAKAPFSCALEDERGEVVTRRMEVRDCTLMLKPGSATWRVRVWTLGQPIAVSTHVAARPLRSFSGGSIPPGEAASVQVSRSGFYETGSGVVCLPAARQGPLEPCGPEASLEAGAWVFGVPEATAAAKLSLSERVDTLEKPEQLRAPILPALSLRRQRSPQPALHLLRVGVPLGDPAYPACRIEGGVAQQRGSACFAATGPTQESLVSWWTPAAEKGEASVSRLSFPVPGTSLTLKPGVQDLTWTGGASVRLVLPSEPVRVQLSLPAEAWAIRVNDQGRAEDLCAPGETLSRCVLSGTGGAVFLWSPAEARVQAEVLSVETTQRTAALATRFEALERAHGQRSLSFEAAREPRQLQVTGAARCLTSLDDGARLEGCDLTVPPGHAGQLLLEVNPGGVRAVLAPESGLTTALLSSLALGPMTALPAAQALRLSGDLVERTFTVTSSAVIHVRGDSGVGALTQDSTVLAVAGLERGFSFDRQLEPGSYRLRVRGFAAQPLTGTVTWTQEPVKTLTEGVSTQEDWVAPGQTRYYRFATASAGNVGLGLQVPAELLECRVLDAGQHQLGEGCQQFLALAQGTYLLSIHAPASLERPLPFKPVLVGLAGAKTDVPEEYLRDFFNRIGANP